MRYMKRLHTKGIEKDLCGGIFMVSTIFLSWGILLLPFTLGWNKSEFTVLDAIFLTTSGFIGLLASGKWFKILSEKKWYETIAKK